jgi:serine/threonine protein kinase
MVKDEACRRRVGTVVRGKWTLVRLLGVGGMAAVYVGEHKIGRTDALKILHPEAARSREVCVRFEREAQAVNRFQHPAAVVIRDIDVTEDGCPFLVLELLEGRSLDERQKSVGRLPVTEALLHGERILDCLAAAHEQGIVHRDIKPANVFLTREGQLKVLDFGLARIAEAGANDGLFTKEGTAMGTTPFMPPEQAMGRPIDERADVFSVGATLFRLLTGRYVHQAKGSFELLKKMAREPAPPLATIVPDVPTDVCAVVDRALAYARDDRWPSARAMLDAVRAISVITPLADQLEPSLRGPEPATVREPPPVSADLDVPISLTGFTELGAEAPRAEPAFVEVTQISPGNGRAPR